jgi:cytochrome c553
MPAGAEVRAIGIVIKAPGGVANMKETMKRTILLTAVMTAVVATASAADVKENWDKHCMKCHGADGAGKTKMGGKLGIKDYTSADAQGKMKDEEMAKAIKEGVKEGETTKMKAFGEMLNDDEIKALVAHIRGLKK